MTSAAHVRSLGHVALLAAAVALIGLFASGCSDDDAAAGCTIDRDCESRGTVCGVQGSCVEVECTSRQECGGQGNRQCFEGKCTGAECTSDTDCQDDARYGAGFQCISALCQSGGGSCSGNLDCVSSNQICDTTTGGCIDPPLSCSGDDDCVYPTTCDLGSGSCGSGCSDDSQCSDAATYCAGSGECLQGCRAGGCSDGETCNTDTRQCASACTVAECAAMDMACDSESGACVARVGKGICETCTLGTDECGGPGDRCAALGGATICTFACESNPDCPSGFECQPITTSVSGCIPISRTCEGCMVDGCPAGQVCDPETAGCITQTDTCAVCQSSIECGSAAGCVAYQGRTRCLEVCGVDGACPADFTCNTSNNTCEPDSGQCTTCDKTATDCPGQQLDEDACVCVDCLVDGDCGSGEICAQGPGECVSGTGSCTSDADCGASYCYGALPPERAGACVECTENSHCGGATCTNFSCETCACPPPQTCGASGQCLNPGSCTGDPDCQNVRGSEWFCDPGSALCYIPGQCNPGDPTIAPCSAPSACGADLLGQLSCQGCDMLTGTGCRPEESCFDLGGIIPGFSLGCIGGGGLGFP